VNAKALTALARDRGRPAGTAEGAVVALDLVRRDDRVHAARCRRRRLPVRGLDRDLLDRSRAISAAANSPGATLTVAIIVFNVISTLATTRKLTGSSWPVVWP
jgi:hypothetical protein